MNQFKNFLQEMLKNALYDIGKTVFLSIGAGGISFSSTYNLLKNKFILSSWTSILFSIGVAALVIFFSLYIYQLISYKYPILRRAERDYNIVDKTVKFTYEGERSTYESEMTLEFNKKTMHYYGKYYWSGSGKGDIKVLNPNFTLTVLKKRNRYIEFVVNFDKAYKKGKKLKLRLKGSMEDPLRQFSPYFSSTVETPTKRLKILLKIDPRKYPIADLEREVIYPNTYGHENCEPISLTADGTYEWVINKPQLGHQYSLTWSFCPLQSNND